MEIIGQGAEAVLYKSGDLVIKDRQAKSYRLPELDNSLRKSRTRHEAKILCKLASSGIRVPSLVSSDEKDMKLEMSFIDGPKLRDHLHNDPSGLGRAIGELVGKVHNCGIIHQDLTTSNMIYSDGIVLIDFGLSFFSDKVEDKAVDLHLLESALSSKHSEIRDECWDAVVLGYKEACTNASEVLSRFEIVIKRGRNKH
ncbi:MAG: KEOPS complex kinase/ATPase Bud32 [Candidatus Nanoarchaeia archaeon]